MIFKTGGRRGVRYRVVFALAEVDPAFAVRDIILADKRDGKPLDAKEGPRATIGPPVGSVR